MGMPDGHEVARQRAERAVAGAVAGYLERMVAAVGGQATARAVFGEPVEGPGATVVPVARVRFVVGGGMGQGGSGLDVGDGGGGGGAVSATPAGYIEIRDGVAAFRPIRRSATELLRPTALVMVAFAVRTVLRRRSRPGPD
jgi:uncharacterized spore protein YtfJ